MGSPSYGATGLWMLCFWDFFWRENRELVDALGAESKFFDGVRFCGSFCFVPLDGLIVDIARTEIGMPHGRCSSIALWRRALRDMMEQV